MIEIGDHVIEVLATAGDNHLGGDDFDERLVQYVIKSFKKETRINLEKDITAVQPGSMRRGKEGIIQYAADSYQSSVYHGRKERAEASRYAHNQRVVQ